MRKTLEERVEDLEEKVAELEGDTPAQQNFVPEDSDNGKSIGKNIENPY